MKKLFLFSTIVFSIVAIAGNFSTYSTVASGESSMSLTPASVEVEAGKRIDIDVIASSPSSYNAAQVDVEYSNQNLKLISATPGTALPSIAHNDHDPDKGLISYALYKIGGTSGEAKLLSMTFEGISGQGTVKLLDSSVILEAGVALASGGTQISTINVTSTTEPSTGGETVPDSSDSQTSDSTNGDSTDSSDAEDDSTTTNTNTDNDDSGTVVNTNSQDDENNNVSTQSSNESTASNSDSSSLESSSTENDDSNANDSTDTTESNSIGKGGDQLPNTGISSSLALFAACASFLGYSLNIIRLKFQ